ncbi:PREDICTED: integrin alpha-9-like [Priapulus caudatus]|uniref:Integrin alpha-9-like n=1 Tax=Priapulus caudatus TaxID=37621 RepID=A0ABM1E951_PRICU|nr:PREDICTED: integrin alpha-9-like [Priapulus caudatus]
MCQFSLVASAVCVAIAFTLLTDSTGAYNLDVDNAIIFHSGKRDVFFGYSVALLRRNEANDRYWLLAGTPKYVNKNPVLDGSVTGDVYICTEHNATCSMLLINETRVQRKRVYLFNNTEYVDIIENKNGQFLGGSMDATDDMITVCGHLWRNRRRRLNYVNGLCFYIDPSTRGRWRIIPNSPLWIKRLQGKDTYYQYFLAVAGFSVHITQDSNKEILFGVPGADNFRGTAIASKYGNESFLDIPLAPSHYFDTSSYFGYSTTSGKLTQDSLTYYAAGAPRLHNHGEVFVYRTEYLHNRTDITTRPGIQIVKRFMGDHPSPQFGEYFGAAVCAVDINGDSMDDLLVGAPQYSVIGDEGRVYVYITEGLGIYSSHIKPLSGGNQPGSRFGSAISTIGDINRDGYSDVAIGAPYENNRVGAVYIYHGAARGIYPRYRQRIGGEDISPVTRSFGWSLSRGLDIDNNLYPDIAVGAYESDQAILLKARPIIAMQATLAFNPEWIPRNLSDSVGSNLEIRICFQFYEKDIKLVAHGVEYTVTSDANYNRTSAIPRATFHDGKQWTNTITEQIMVNNTKPASCATHTLHINNETQDLLNALVFSVSYELTQQTKPPCRTVCPMLDANKPNSLIKRVFFTRDCGSDSMCVSDLVLNSTVEFADRRKRLQLTAGRDTGFSIRVTLRNDGEDAYNTMLVLAISTALTIGRVTSFGQVPVTCILDFNVADEGDEESDQLDDDEEQVEKMMAPLGDKSKAITYCLAGNPLISGQTVECLMEIELATEHGSYPSEAVIELNAITASTEENATTFDNNVSHTIHLQYLVDMAASGISIPEQLSIDNTAGSNFSSNQRNITHLFDVHNNGPTSVNMSQVVIKLPFYASGVEHQIIILRGVQMKNNNFTSTPVTCVGHKRYIHYKVRANSENGHRNLINDDHDEDKAHELNTAGSRIVTLGCDVVRCIRITCDISSLDAGESNYIAIHMELMLDHIEKLKAKISEINYISEAAVILDGAGFNIIQPDHHLPDTAKITTILNYTVELVGLAAFDKRVVIGVGVGAALLALIIIIFILVKCNFFKRPEMERLRELRKESVTSRIELMEEEQQNDGLSD